MNNNILSHEDILDLLIPISNLVKRYKLDKDFLKLDSMSSFTISINDFTKKLIINSNRRNDNSEIIHEVFMTNGVNKEYEYLFDFSSTYPSLVDNTYLMAFVGCTYHCG